MYGNQKWKCLQEVAKPYALDILEELRKGQMRFSELKGVCLSQKTLTMRLHELEECGIIERVIEKPKKQKIKVFYTLTPKGKQTIELALKFMKIE
ncbi:MAG: helix-turn-helix domain-containing protein [Candidatus Woesearchaeota archaeon]|nr:helix-turn-helix domain-containing protein [Candidatus Woesearchaeota archaeon]